MSRVLQNEYEPNYAVPPGEVLQEKLEEIRMTQAELAQRTGRTTKLISEIIKGKAPIVPDTALQFERVLGVPAAFWSNLESLYQETLARIRERDRLQASVEWLKRFPVKAMIALKWIRPADDEVGQLQVLLGFLGVASPEVWQARWEGMSVCFRRSAAFESDPYALGAWLRKGELDAQSVRCATYDAGKFRSALKRVRGLTCERPEVFQPAVVRECAAAGVAVVFVPELPGARVCGATRWLSPVKALVQLSLRYNSNDQLWFSLFHEAGHILLHGKRDIFIEADESRTAQEQEANTFAADQLIPPTDFQRFIAENPRLSKAAIERFAEEAGIAPGIVVGRLQHDGALPYSHCNDLKVRLQWRPVNE